MSGRTSTSQSTQGREKQRKETYPSNHIAPQILAYHKANQEEQVEKELEVPVLPMVPGDHISRESGEPHFHTILLLFFTQCLIILLISYY